MVFLTGGYYLKINMKGAFLYIILFLLLPFQFRAQDVELKRQVIGSSGSSFQGNDLMISSTIGETISGSSSDSPVIFTQGFQQTSEKSAAKITYEISVKDETCPDTKDGQIVIQNLDGCEDGSYQIEWSNSEMGASLSNISAGWYGFVISACGRVINDSALVGLIYESSCLLKFYTAFSPNNDGVNDFWIIDNITSVPNSKNELIIYNRWGDEVQSFVNYDNVDKVWDGTFENGKEATEGTYYYVAKVQNQSFSGYIELTR